MQSFVAAVALLFVFTGEIQTFKHIGEHFPHTHEHRHGSARKQK